LSTFGNRKGIPVYSANRLQRRAANLLGYDLRIEYRKSTDFGQADAFSRLISSHSTPDEEIAVAALQVEFDTDVLSSLPSGDLQRTPLDYREGFVATISEEIHQVSLAGPQTSPPARRLVTARRILPTPRVPHGRARMYSVQGTCGYSNRAADQTPSPRTSGDPTNEITSAQIHVLAVHGPRH